ncbi:MAG: O-antigen ligase family protein [Melioribacteraceae bacterium]
MIIKVLQLPMGVKIMGAFFVVSLSLISLFNFYFTFNFLLLLIFLPYLTIVHQAVIFSVILFISCKVNSDERKISLRSNDIWVALVLFFLSSLPSIINTPEKLLSFRDMLNLVALILVFYATLNGIKKIKYIKSGLLFFIAAVFLHSIWVIYLGAGSSKRVFGILGVYFIDFAGLAALVSFIFFIYSCGGKRLLYGLLFLVNTLGLVFTQTRNAWLSFGISFITLIIFLVFNDRKYKIKKHLVITMVAFFLVISAAIFILFVNKEGNRVVGKSQEVVLTNDPESVGLNSFVSRLFIWHTAIVAYTQHPILGIGAYAFKHVSQNYYTIPRGFYDIYVEGRTPHVAFLQVLTETGIIGLFFFLNFIIKVFKKSLRSIKHIQLEENIVPTLAINWSLFYIIFSMMMTESWLYGQYIVWFGILLGFQENNYNLLKSQTKHGEVE